MKRLFSLILVLTLCLSSAWAQEDSPDALIQKITEDVLSIVRQDKDIQSGDTKKAIKLIDEKVLPHLDFHRMTALALGKDWKKAAPEQQERLVQEFQTLLVRTYSNALSGYRDQTIRYKPSNRPAGETNVTVKAEILQPGGRSIPLDYSVEKGPSGWKIHDVIVAGVSLVTNYRSAFTQEVRDNGIDGLIKKLVEKNQQLEK
jgi:phospholipid transport system substrate-binding protein